MNPLSMVNMMTAFPETRTEALHADVDDFVTKPFHVADLLARVQALKKECTASSATHVGGTDDE